MCITDQRGIVLIASTASFARMNATRTRGYGAAKICQQGAPPHRGHLSLEHSAGWVTLGVQVCVRCHQDKPAAEFPPRPSATDGLYSYCRICRTASANSSRLRVKSRQAQQADEDSEGQEVPLDMQEG